MKRCRSRIHRPYWRNAGRLPPLLQLAQEAIALLNRQGKIVAANPFAAQLLEIPASRLIGRPWKAFVNTPVDLTRLHRGAQPQGQYISPRRYQPGQPSPAQPQILEWSLTREVMPARHLVVFREIGDRRRAEAELAQQQQQAEPFAEVTLKICQSPLQPQEEQLGRITNALPALIAYIDQDQRYRFNNQTYQTWLGQSPASLKGKHLKSVWGEASYEQMRLPLEKVLSGEAVTYEREILDLDDQLRSLAVTYIPDLDALDQSVQGFFALSCDISDRKATERRKDEFISVVSHELRTPLTSMHSALKILSTGRLGLLSQDGQQMLEIADENTERLVRLVNNVLDLQRIESGEVTMEKQTCDAAELITQAIAAMQPMAQQQGIHLVSQPSQQLIWADADSMLQALTNLLSNAIKFSQAGTQVVMSLEAQADQTLFHIRDQGCGIPPDKLETIFERFQQVDSSQARRKGGTGLGLTICRGIIEKQGGRIWVNSQLGQGSTFSFTVPSPPPDSGQGL